MQRDNSNELDFPTPEEIRRADDKWRSNVDAALEDLRGVCRRLEIAMFATDENNPNQSVGVMTMMTRIVHHIETVCGIAVFAKKALLFLVGLVGTLLTIAVSAKAIGLL